MFKPKHQYADIAVKYSGRECTLDGKPARVRGALLPFAKVGQLFGGPEFDFAWPTVQRIIDRDGAFKSE